MVAWISSATACPAYANEIGPNALNIRTISKALNYNRMAIDDESDDPGIEAHYMYMAQLQESSGRPGMKLDDLDQERDLLLLNSFSRPQLKSNHLEDRVMSNNSQGKKQEVEDHHDYSRYTWTHFLRSKDETPGVLIDFLTLVQRGLHAQVTTVRTDKGMEFINKTLHAYFAKEGIRQRNVNCSNTKQKWRCRTDGNRTLVEAARTMQAPLKFLCSSGLKSTANNTCFQLKTDHLYSYDMRKHLTISSMHRNRSTSNEHSVNLTTQTPLKYQLSLHLRTFISSKTNTENAQFDDDEFINIFSTPVQEQGETSSRHVDSSNMHTFYQHHPSAQRWTKDHPLEQVIGNPSQSLRIKTFS
ncbi:retrovirus-related pol polyprotein from transposon TNT 1-94 [Tanacetum coccineum]